MTNVFISYSRKDIYFAEWLTMKLSKSDISVWSDRGKLRAGDEWRDRIDQGISESDLIIVAVSESSAKSAYVTYEWASAMGKMKPVIPLVLADCEQHPKLDVIQHIDFRIPSNEAVKTLVEHITERISADVSPDLDIAQISQQETTIDGNALTILRYLDRNGFQMVSYDRIKEQIIPTATDELLNSIISDHPNVFRRAKVKGGKPGIAKL